MGPAKGVAPSVRSWLPGLVIIGASTGGPNALMNVLPAIPPDLPVPLLIIQHMMPGFTRSLAQRLDEQAAINVGEATVGQRLAAGTGVIAPGGKHLTMSRHGRVRLNMDPPQNGVRPAVDVTLESVAPLFGQRLLVVIMTGMGRDGVRGCKTVKNHGGRVLAQDRASSVVFGMPKAVIEAGLSDHVLALEDLGIFIRRWSSALMPRDAGERRTGARRGG